MNIPSPLTPAPKPCFSGVKRADQRDEPEEFWYQGVRYEATGSEARELRRLTAASIPTSLLDTTDRSEAEARLKGYTASLARGAGHRERQWVPNPDKKGPWDFMNPFIPDGKWV